MASIPFQKIITLEPGERSGKPTIRGTHMTVYDVLSYLAAGMTPDQILDDFPYLTAEDPQACLSYAAERERSLRRTLDSLPARVNSLLMNSLISCAVSGKVVKEIR